MPIITLTTDFGTRDAYVGAMKGVIFTLCPSANVVDVSHEVGRHAVSEAAYTLAAAAAHYPPNAIHVAVVDPGVGSSRRALALESPHGVFLAPDNGILTYIMTANGAMLPPGRTTADEGADTAEMYNCPVPDCCRVYVLDKPSYWLAEVSRTFHGRDVFAPCAAHLANGTPISDLGSPVESVACLRVPHVTTCDGIDGRVVHVDWYGNLVTNIPASAVEETSVVNVRGRSIAGLSASYEDNVGGLLAIIGSRGTVEISVGRGSAASLLDAGVGARVTVDKT